MIKRFARALLLWAWPPDPVIEPRGVCVYTGLTAEFYPLADCWTYDSKDNLTVQTPSGQQWALFPVGTYARVEAGNPPDQAVERK